jgi:hypothetical protein
VCERNDRDRISDAPSRFEELVKPDVPSLGCSDVGMYFLVEF